MWPSLGWMLTAHMVKVFSQIASSRLDWIGIVD